MRLPRKAGLALTAILLAVSGMIAAGGTAQANTSQATCNNNNPDFCMNRNGGGTGNGTHIIGWTEDLDNNEDIILVPISGFVCGKYGTVQNGQNGDGCLGPFTPGSGLNARYQGVQLYKLNRHGTGSCVIPDSSQVGAVLGGCTANGYVYAWSSSAYLINVFVSNQSYAQGFGGNDPAFLDGTSAQGSQLQYSAPHQGGIAGRDQWFEVF